MVERIMLIDGIASEQKWEGKRVYEMGFGKKGACLSGKYQLCYKVDDKGKSKGGVVVPHPTEVVDESGVKLVSPESPASILRHHLPSHSLPLPLPPCSYQEAKIIAMTLSFCRDTCPGGRSHRILLAFVQFPFTKRDREPGGYPSDISAHKSMGAEQK